MIKSAIIGGLLIALLGVAFFTRPAKETFKDFYLNQQTSADKNVLLQIGHGLEAQAFLDHVTYSDKLLWIDVQENGQTYYTGAFGHWFNRTSNTSTTPAKP